MWLGNVHSTLFVNQKTTSSEVDDMAERLKTAPRSETHVAEFGSAGGRFPIRSNAPDKETSIRDLRAALGNFQTGKTTEVARACTAARSRYFGHTRT